MLCDYIIQDFVSTYKKIGNEKAESATVLPTPCQMYNPHTPALTSSTHSLPL